MITAIDVATDKAANQDLAYEMNEVLMHFFPNSRVEVREHRKGLTRVWVEDDEEIVRVPTIIELRYIMALLKAAEAKLAYEKEL